MPSRSVRLHHPDRETGLVQYLEVRKLKLIKEMSKATNSICSLWRWLENKSNLNNQFIRAVEQSGAHYTSLKGMIREGYLIPLKSLLQGASNIVIRCNMTITL